MDDVSSRYVVSLRSKVVDDGEDVLDDYEKVD